MQNRNSADHTDQSKWPLIAHRWQQLGSPLRPAEDDLIFFRAAIEDWNNQSRSTSPRALILGVTPEFYRLPWPANTSLKAVYKTIGMINYK